MDELVSFLFGTEPIRWIQQFFGLGHPLPFRIFSLLGDTWGMILVVGAAFWLFGRDRLYATAAVVVAGAAAKVLLSAIFQQERPRGEGIVVYEHLDVSSFPSGHVFEAVGPWGLLFALGCISLGLVALVVTLVALGRLYLGTHYVGDVLGGVVFGAAFVFLFHRGWPGARRWLALEHRYVKYRAEGDPRARGAAKVAIGAAGIAAMLLVDRSLPESALLPGTLTAGVATLWAVAGAPFTFRRLGWTARETSLPPRLHAAMERHRLAMSRRHGW